MDIWFPLVKFILYENPSSMLESNAYMSALTVGAFLAAVSLLFQKARDSNETEEAREKATRDMRVCLAIAATSLIFMSIYLLIPLFFLGSIGIVLTFRKKDDYAKQK